MGNIMGLINKLGKTSIIKTIRFNIHYFGIKTLFKPYAFIARGTSFVSLKGDIKLTNKNIGAITIGYSSNGISNNSTTKCAINITGHVIVHNRLRLFKGAVITCMNDGLLEVNNLTVTGDTKIICHKNIQIGNDCLIS